MRGKAGVCSHHYHDKLRCHFNWSQSTTSTLLSKSVTGRYVKDRPHSRCPRMTIQQNDTFVVRQAQNTPFTTSLKTCEQLIANTHQHNHLHTANLKAYKLVGNLMLTRLTTNEDLLLQLQSEWANILQMKITKLVRSMITRMRECIAKHGGPIHYWHHTLSWLIFQHRVCVFNYVWHWAHMLNRYTTEIGVC